MSSLRKHEESEHTGNKFLPNHVITKYKATTRGGSVRIHEASTYTEEIHFF